MSISDQEKELIEAEQEADYYGRSVFMHDYLRELRRKAHAEDASMPTDAERLDWISARRVVVVRANTRPECWKVDTMDGPYIRGNLRDAIDAAMTCGDQRSEPTVYDSLRAAVQLAIDYLDSVKETLGDHYRNDEAKKVLGKLRAALDYAEVLGLAPAGPAAGAGRETTDAPPRA